MKYEDNIFSNALDQLFENNFNIKNFTAEMEDKKGTFYRWCKTDLERKVNDRLNIPEEEFSSDKIIKFKNFEKILLRADSIKILNKNDKPSLFNKDIVLGVRFNTVLKYLAKKTKDESIPRIKQGKIHISTTTSSKFTSDLMSFSRLGGTEYVGLIDVVKKKWSNYSKYIVEMERMLFYLQALYREKQQGYEKDHDKKGVSIFELGVSGKKKYSMLDYKTKTIIEREDEQETIEYILFVFSHSDSKKTAYKEILSEMHESTKSSYHRSAEGEKEALTKLENISISSSDIQEIMKYIGKTSTGERQLSHMDFDSAIKFFFILGENFFKNPIHYADSLYKYYGTVLGKQMQEIIANALSFMEESKTAQKRLEDYKPSKKYLREWEDKPPLRGNRMILLTLPKFIISQHVEFTKPLIDMMGFISSMTDLDFEIKNKFYMEIMNHPYMKRLNATIRRRGIQSEIKTTYSQICSKILMVHGKQKLYLEDLIMTALRDHRVDEKLFSGLKPIKMENNKQKRIKELQELETKLISPKLKEAKRSEIETQIKRMKKAIGDEAQINKSEIDIVFSLLSDYSHKFIHELNREEEKYFFHSEGSKTYITKRFETSIAKKQQKQVIQKEWDTRD